MKKVLILGAGGTLGGALVKEFGRAGYQVFGWDKQEAEVTDFALLETKIFSAKPDLLINAVAYNAVDAAENNVDEQKKAMLLNAEVPKQLAVLAEKLGAVFIHFSTDYVFDGTSKLGYAEDAMPAPASFYGQSKYAGEKNVADSGANYYLVRLSRLFGDKGASEASKKSFVDIMREKINEPLVKVVNEEISSPTYAPDLAKFVHALWKKNMPYGIYHGANSGQCAWFEFAQEIFKILNKEVNLQPVPASEFPRQAKRPNFSVLLNTKMPPQRDWRDALREYLQKI